MRSFFISLTFFIITVTAVCVNAFFVDARLGDIVALVEQLEDAERAGEGLSDILPEVERVCELWHSSRGFFSLSIDNAVLRDCTGSLESLHAYCKSDSLPDFNAALSDCLNRLTTLLRRESFSLLNIV